MVDIYKRSTQSKTQQGDLSKHATLESREGKYK